jgi:hypothetical protein
MHDVSREHIINLEDLRLWEIWYTGSTPFPSEVSPFPLTSPLFSLLLSPHSCPLVTLATVAQPRSSRDHRLGATPAPHVPSSDPR